MIRSLTLFALMFSAPAAAQVAQGPKNVPDFEPAFENQTRAPDVGGDVVLDVTQLAHGLAHPWGIAILPGGGYLVTERVGRLNYLAADGAVTHVEGLPEIAVQGQGGLLDVAVAEDFGDSRRLYLTFARNAGRGLATVAVSARLSEDMRRLTDLREIFVQTPAISSGVHFGSRIVLDGDTLFITIGDRGGPENAQDLRATIGKVVRVKLDGGIPDDNPFVGQDGALDEIWSYGLRNAQGAALHPETGELWTLEHGPAGGDELNRIEAGRNYGWPVISYGRNYNGTPVGAGRTEATGMEQPRYYWDPVIAPGDFTFYTGDLFEGWQGDVLAASLNPGGLVRLTLDGDRVTSEARYLGNMGRVRDVEVDRDGSLLILTDAANGGVYRVTPR